MEDEKTKSQLIKELADLRTHALKIEERCREWLQADEIHMILASIVENSDDGIIGKTLDGTITSWNKGAERLYGYTASEIIGKNVSILVPPNHANEMPKLLEIIKKGGKIDHYETQRITKDSRTIFVSLTISPIKDRSGNIIGASTIARDTTQRRAMEEALKKSEAILSRAQLIAHVGNFALDVRTRDMRWSDEIFRIFGYKPQEFQPTLDWLTGMIHQDDREFVVKSVDAALNENKLFHIDFRIIRRDGSIRYMNMVADKVVRDHAGKPTWMYGIVQDITERKLVEERLREAKARAELYVDIMGHDINNLNQSAEGNLELIQDDENLSPDQKESIMDALNAVKGSANIIDNVRKVQAINEEKEAFRPMDINDMILACIKEAPNPDGKKVSINYTPKSGMFIKGNSLMKEVFCNILGNSIKYSGDEVAIDIRINKVARADKEFYDVSIADNGIGIPDQLKPKLFNRFQRGTTKAHGKGLGLFIVKSLVERVSGNVTIEDRVPGDYTQGAKIIVSLPVCEECRHD
jgi:PAS domain S-box-containing protein